MLEKTIHFNLATPVDFKKLTKKNLPESVWVEFTNIMYNLTFENRDLFIDYIDEKHTVNKVICIGESDSNIQVQIYVKFVDTGIKTISTQPTLYSMEMDGIIFTHPLGVCRHLWKPMQEEIGYETNYQKWKRSKSKGSY